MKQKFVIISHDAMVTEDVERLKHKAVFRDFLARGSWIKKMRSVYPSITYPCHTSMMTGCYPDKTGLYNNETDELFRLGCDWHWFRRDHHARTLADAAKEKGYTVGNVFWPVTGGDASIDYNVAEYWSQGGSDTIDAAFRRAGASDEVMKRAVLPYLGFLTGKERRHPMCDNFFYMCAAAMIREFKPDIMFLHPAEIDGARHSYGLWGDEVDEAIDSAAYGTKLIVDAVKDIGEFDNTNFIIMSDHGQINISRVVNPNVELARRGLITLDADGKPVSYDAFVKSTGASAQVFLRDPSDRKLAAKVYGVLCDMKESGLAGIERVYTTEEIAAAEHLSGPFSFVLEGDGYTAFGGRWTGTYVSGYNVKDYRTGQATHGHFPDKGPQPTMIACGPAIKSGVVLERRSIVDMAPTVAKIIGASLPDADGKPIDEIIA